MTNTTEQHRKASVEAAMKTVRQTDNAQHLVDAIKRFDSCRRYVAEGMTLKWSHGYGGANSKKYQFAAVFANGTFYVTDGKRYTWDEMVAEWVTHNVTPDEVRYVAVTNPLEAF